jgi:SAM-dependent methyltransferase
MSQAPSNVAFFDRAYRAPITLWGDVRVPPEVKAIAERGGVSTVLELGCGVGRFSRHLAQAGLEVTGVDFSAVAIDKAKKRVEGDDRPPRFLVGDVTRLDAITGPFQASFDVGCFHCLDRDAQKKYVAEIDRLLAPDGTHLIWALDRSPSDICFSPDLVAEIFAPRFSLFDARASRRRVIASHWYWLKRG